MQLLAGGDDEDEEYGDFGGGGAGGQHVIQLTEQEAEAVRRVSGRNNCGKWDRFGLANPAAAHSSKRWVSLEKRLCRRTVSGVTGITSCEDHSYARPTLSLSHAQSSWTRTKEPLPTSCLTTPTSAAMTSRIAREGVSRARMLSYGSTVCCARMYVDA
jgi:hypothetical protein